MYKLLDYHMLATCRVSATHGNPGNLVEFEITPGNTGNFLEFY